MASASRRASARRPPFNSQIGGTRSPTRRSTDACCSDGEALGQPGLVGHERPRAPGRALVGGLREHAGDPRPDPALRVGGPVHAVGEVAEQQPAAVVEQHQQQLVLGREVAVERLRGQAALAQDVAQRRVDGAASARSRRRWRRRCAGARRRRRRGGRPRPARPPGGSGTWPFDRSTVRPDGGSTVLSILRSPFAGQGQAWNC